MDVSACWCAMVAAPYFKKMCPSIFDVNSAFWPFFFFRSTPEIDLVQTVEKVMGFSGNSKDKITAFILKSQSAPVKSVDAELLQTDAQQHPLRNDVREGADCEHVNA